MKTILKHTILGATLLAASVSLADSKNPLPGTNPPKPTSAQEAKVEAAHLDLFDDLDYNVYSNQQWTELHRSHTKDVVVHWPDDHTTKGIDRHIEDLKAMFVWAPDTRIKQHPVKIAQGDWTAVIGVYEGTFTKPMPISNGNSSSRRTRRTRS